MISQLGRDSRSLIRNALELSLYSKGSWSYESIMNLSAGERDLAAEVLNDKLELIKKNPMLQI